MILKWIILNLKFLLKKSGFLICTLYSILGFIATWCSFEGIFPANATLVYKISISIIILFCAFLLAFIGNILWYYYHNSICVLTKDNGKVRVRYGDFINELKQNKKRKNYIIPANRCFDTIVDDKIIARNSIHGKFLEYLYSHNHFSPNSLSDSINFALSKSHRIVLNNDEKPLGNKFRYPIGSIIDVGSIHNNHYFMLGLTMFDKDLAAYITKEEYIVAIQRLIEYCNKHSQGYPVVLPLIGAGLSRTNFGKNEILRYLISAFEINRDIINCDFEIIVWDQDKENVIITNL